MVVDEIWKFRLAFLSTAPSGSLAVQCWCLTCRLFCKISFLFLLNSFAPYRFLQTLRWHLHVSGDQKDLGGQW